MDRAADEEDRLLIQAISQGDRQAIADLYKRHSKRVFLFIKRFLKEDSLSEDITNDVFIEVWRKAENYEGRSKVSSWILGMARFKALSEIRKHRPNSTSDDVLNAITDEADTPEVTSQKRDKGEALKECINNLSTEHRLVIDLIYYHDKSIREVAEILKIPENTVKTRCFHARKQLSISMSHRGLDRGWP